MTSQDRFPRCGDRLWGYETAQVDDLLDRLDALRTTTTPHASSDPCLLYTSDAADDIL